MPIWVRRYRSRSTVLSPVRRPDRPTVCVSTELLPTLPGHIPHGIYGKPISPPSLSLADLDAAIGLENAWPVTPSPTAASASPHYRPSSNDELAFVLSHHWNQIGRYLDADDFTDIDAVAVVHRTTGGNFRLRRTTLRPDPAHSRDQPTPHHHPRSRRRRPRNTRHRHLTVPNNAAKPCHLPPRVTSTRRIRHRHPLRLRCPSRDRWRRLDLRQGL